jgi:hypothetical protein
MAARERAPKPCAVCSTPARALFRVKTSVSAPWQLLCKSCQSNAKANTGYQYGGTWKSAKRH